MDVNASCTRMVTGASDNQLRVWALEAKDDGEHGEGAADGVDDDGVIAVYMGSVARQGNGRKEA